MLDVLPAATLALVDYYRLCRNEELHNEVGSSAESGAATAFARLPVDKVKSQFGTAPNAPDSLTIEDAVLCSKAWQDASTHLCRLLVWEELAEQLIAKRFETLPAKRRRNGAKQFLRIECLWNESQVENTMSKLGWSA